MLLNQVWIDEKYLTPGTILQAKKHVINERTYLFVPEWNAGLYTHQWKEYCVLNNAEIILVVRQPYELDFGSPIENVCLDVLYNEKVLTMRIWKINERFTIL